MKDSVKHVIFDLGGVLLNIDISLITKGFSEVMTMDESAIHQFKHEVVPAYETGKITTEKFLASLKPYMKPGKSLDNVVAIWNSIILDMPKKRLEMLVELRKNYKVHLLSNINELHAHCFEDNFQRWFSTSPQIYFDSFFYSHEIGRRKPETETYKWALEQLNADSNEVLFIDDMPENIEGARNTGIVAIQLMNQKMDVVDLMEDLGLLNK